MTAFALVCFALRSSIRMIRVFRALPSFDVTLRTIGDILPVTLQFGAVLLSNLYIFSVINALMLGLLSPCRR